MLAPELAALANTPRRDRGSTRTLYSYPAKFQGHLPAALIERFSRPGELVVDPFVGGGTTALEAMLLGRRAHGHDLNPLACLVSRVKTTPLDARGLEVPLGEPVSLLDDEDRRCLGPAIAEELERLAGGIAAGPFADLARLALVQTFRTAGRRDFTAPSILPIFRRRLAEAADAVAGLSPSLPSPTLVHARADRLALPDASAALVVTSPPYKDVDVEYALLQIQRPALGVSRRSRFAWRLLGVPPLPKRHLQGGIGARYWLELAPALGEIRRVLRPGGTACFWLGWRHDDERVRFREMLGAAGITPSLELRARLGRDRGASSRSHHGRDEFAGVAVDYLVVGS